MNAANSSAVIGVKYSGLVQGSYQINLFDDTMEHIQLMQQMDRISFRCGCHHARERTREGKSIEGSVGFISPVPTLETVFIDGEAERNG